VLLTALLGAVGVGSYPALVSFEVPGGSFLPYGQPVRSRHHSDSPRRFGPVRRRDTEKSRPFGFLAYPHKGPQALLIPANAAASLVDTPADPPVPSYDFSTWNRTISADGTLDGRIRIGRSRGDPEVMFRAAYHSTPQNQWKSLPSEFSRHWITAEMSAMWT
jgi:hypothetical protein